MFRESLLGQFVIVLLQVIVHKMHDLLQEEIVIVIYNMASVDFELYYSRLLPEFLTNIDGLNDEQKRVLVCNFKLETVSSLFEDILRKYPDSHTQITS